MVEEYHKGIRHDNQRETWEVNRNETNVAIRYSQRVRSDAVGVIARTLATTIASMVYPWFNMESGGREEDISLVEQAAQIAPSLISHHTCAGSLPKRELTYTRVTTKSTL